MKALRNGKKDAREEETKQFVNMFLKLIDEKRDDIAKAMEAGGPKIREMSTMKPEDVHRRMTI